MADTDPVAALEEIRSLLAARDELIKSIGPAGVDIAPFNAAQDKLAAKVPLLLAAVDRVLGMAESAETSAGAAGVPVTQARLSPAVLREAITSALTGEEASDGE